ncbi:protease complex subunit PrcB family protein [Thermincola ferriacetica]|uniref:protease complex subunit PrcB family protein n=1 Tax=Thermincola ferriacetica TaxID=281456 RepID=UPI0009FAD4A3|nr:protease complex subunit PrcB family protein [Thermincola ferriacetica]
MRLVRLLTGVILLLTVIGCQPGEGDKVDISKVSDIGFHVLQDKEIPQRIKNFLENNKEIEQAMLVDDDGTFYAVITRGRKNTGGYGVEIEKITLRLVDGNSKLTVYVRYTDPKPGSVVTQALTYPHLVAEVNLKQKPQEIKFDIKTKNQR